MNKYLTPKNIILALLVVIFASCSSTKYVDKLIIKTDSTALHERDSISQLKKEDSVYYNNLIESMSIAEIQFRDTGSVKIIYRSDGSIESVEGQVKYLNNRLNKSQSETSIWKTKYDSLSKVTVKDSIQVRTDIKTVEIRKKVNVLPWWLVLVAAGVLIVGWRLGKIKFVK